MRVTLDALSGRQNFSWELTDDEVRHLLNRLGGKPLSTYNQAEAGLGYRGFILTARDDEQMEQAGIPETLYLGGLLDTSASAASQQISQKESDETALWLLHTVKGAIQTEVLQHSENVLKDRLAGKVQAAPTQHSQVDKEHEKALAVACTLNNTPFNPAFWNTPQAQPRNNCYNYSMNYRSDSFAQPGRISGHIYHTLNCFDVGNGASFDGCRTSCAGIEKLVALVIWPGVDYHWYRYHSNGFWGHKPGGTAARNTDNRGRVINPAAGLTPQTCDRGPYTIFCGYRYSPKGMKVE